MLTTSAVLALSTLLVSTPAPASPAQPRQPAIVLALSRTHHRVPAYHSSAGFEPASGRYQLTRDSVAYARPSRRSAVVKRLEAGKFVLVTGSSVDYVRVRLKDGRVAYVSKSVLQLFKPADKNFILSRDSPVYSAPSQRSRRLAVVHAGHNVHVVGIMLSYLKIRMRSGLVGFIPIDAVE